MLAATDPLQASMLQYKRLESPVAEVNMWLKYWAIIDPPSPNIGGGGKAHVAPVVAWLSVFLLIHAVLD